jgi:hypothetical protein
MKTLLYFSFVLLLCSSCSEPKMKLRAPEVLGTEKQVKMDSVVNDSIGVVKETLAD